MVDQRTWWNSRDGLWMRSPGRVASKQVRVHDEPWERRYTEACYGKNYEIYKGTWESNPGPSTCKPAKLPIEPFSAFVNIMNGEYNI